MNAHVFQLYIHAAPVETNIITYCTVNSLPPPAEADSHGWSVLPGPGEIRATTAGCREGDLLSVAAICDSIPIVGWLTPREIQCASKNEPIYSSEA